MPSPSTPARWRRCSVLDLVTDKDVADRRGAGAGAGRGQVEGDRVRLAAARARGRLFRQSLLRRRSARSCCRSIRSAPSRLPKRRVERSQRKPPEPPAETPAKEAKEKEQETEQAATAKPPGKEETRGRRGPERRADARAAEKEDAAVEARRGGKDASPRRRFQETTGLRGPCQAQAAVREKDEIQMTKLWGATHFVARHSCFGLLSSFVIRASSFLPRY